VVCRSVTLVSPAKTAEPIKILFGLWTRVGPRNHVLDGVQIPMGRDNTLHVRRRCGLLSNYFDHLIQSILYCVSKRPAFDLL